MGKASRLKRARREQRLREQPGPPMKREAFNILRSIHKDIQNQCHENSRRCWEYLVEMIAHSTGWPTDTNESGHLSGNIGDENRFVEFAECWLEEVTYAKENRVPFSEPIGELLEHLEATNLHFDQYFTPMSVVRLLNEINLHDLDTPENGYARGLDPCCGTGRFMIDALVFNDKLIMGNLDIDLWMQRVAKINARLLARWTNLPVSIGPWEAVKAGRARFIWGDSLMVDLGFKPNWSLSWYWTPQHWQADLKIEGYAGNYNQWLEDGKPRRDGLGAPGEVQFDYSMKKAQKEGKWEATLLKETG
jgi:hypothetical protein